jgi:hypothetical protein
MENHSVPVNKYKCSYDLRRISTHKSSLYIVDFKTTIIEKPDNKVKH